MLPCRSNMIGEAEARATTCTKVKMAENRGQCILILKVGIWESLLNGKVSTGLYIP